MSRTRSAAKKAKVATGAATAASTGILRRSQRVRQLKTNGSDHFSLGPPGVRENAQNKPDIAKPSTGVATATPTFLPRRSQRLLQSNVKSAYRCPSDTGASENAQNRPETTTTTVLRRSQRLLQSKAGSKSCSIDGNTRQDCDLLKKSSVRRSGKSNSLVNIGAVRLNFDDVGTVKGNDPIGNKGGSSERRITRSLSAQNGQGKSVLRITDTAVEVQQGRDSMTSPSLAVNIGKIIQKDDDSSKRCVVELEGLSSESDSPLVSKLEKRCFRRTSKSKKRVGVKKRQKQTDDVVPVTDCGWTKDQEKALQKAYLAAKPTPNFWKMVARLVPGKSSQECFDKVNSENLTPLVPRPRSRCERKALSPQQEILFPESELLPEPKSKRRSRRKTHINQKMVRNLMRKNSHVEPDNKADFFHVLEPMVNPLPEALPLSPLLSTPTGSTENGSSSLSCRTRSLSNQKKSKSRFSGKSEIPIASPPILKPVRNMALHDKYVDQLHAREAKRKTISTACNRKSTLIKGDVNEPLLKNKDVVRAAKESLISDARDVINKFRHSEMYIDSCNDSEQEYDDEDEDDENAL